MGVSPFFVFGLDARWSFTLHVALFLARAFRREIGGSAAALRHWAVCHRVTICLWVSYLPDFHAGAGRVGVLERGLPIEGVHSPSLLVGVPLHLQQP